MKKINYFLTGFFALCLFTQGVSQGAIPHDEIPRTSNAISYETRLLNMEKMEETLWPHVVYSQTQINSVKSNTIKDSWTANNLSYTLKAFPREDPNFILPLLNRGILNYETGDYYDAYRYLTNAEGIMSDLKQKGFSLGKEQVKIFKGESYEQAMVSFYLGLMLYKTGDYENARAAFSNSLDLDREAVPVQKDLEKMAKKYASKTKEITEQEFIDTYNFLGADHRLANYMLAKTWQKLGEENNVNISLRNANAWKKIPESIKTTTAGNFLKAAELYDSSPPADNPYARIARLRDDNLVVLVEMGFAPEKQLGGVEGNKDYISPRPYPERKAVVYVDGQKLGDAYPMFNLLHQALCTPRSAKDTGQTGKAVGKLALSLMASVVSSDLGDLVNNKWSVAADTRRWGTLPNEIHVVSGKVEPGLHNISVIFYDSEGNPLHHYEQVLYYVPVKDGDETILTVRALRDKNNIISDFYGSKIKYDEKKEEATFNPMDVGGIQIGSRLDVFTVDFSEEGLNDSFLKEGLAVSSGYYSNTNLQKQKFDSTFKGLTIEKVGVIEVEKMTSKKASCRLVDGDLNSGKAFFVTDYKLPFNVISESSNLDRLEK